MQSQNAWLHHQFRLRHLMRQLYYYHTLSYVQKVAAGCMWWHLLVCVYGMKLPQELRKRYFCCSSATLDRSLVIRIKKKAIWRVQFNKLERVGEVLLLNLISPTIHDTYFGDEDDDKGRARWPYGIWSRFFINHLYSSAMDMRFGWSSALSSGHLEEDTTLRSKS